MNVCSRNPDVWFSTLKKDVERAKAGCAVCPLATREACRDEGWKHEYGTFGGLTHLDRKAQNPDRYDALVKSNNAAAIAKDRALNASENLDALVGKVSGEAIAASHVLLRTAPNRMVAAAGMVLDHGLTREQVAVVFGAHVNSVCRWVKDYSTETLAHV